MRELPRPGQVYRHFKGNIYRIITLASHSETGEMLVIYKRDDTEEKSYARPLDMFMSEVDRKKYPNVREKYRFTLWQEGDDPDTGACPDSSSETLLNPLLEAFLDAGTISEKVDRFYDMKKIADDEMLSAVAASLDLDISGTRDEKAEEILRALRAKEKYESNRLRGQ
ncbi:MAG: DUF1653 domain-containing protein [Lachnospiraceae bacterium]|nr:DUF1653 domain-containing protein [Lachnospiraceae bacterium]